MFEQRQMARPGRHTRLTAALMALALAVSPGPGWAQEAAVVSALDIVHPVFAENGMVAPWTPPWRSDLRWP
jgi:hypothetical protein